MAEQQLSPDTEVWKPVLGFEGCYEVSSLGRVKSLARTTTFQRCGGTVTREVPECLLAAPVTPLKGGYREVRLSDHKRARHAFVCHLVCEAFHGPKPFDGACVLHWNDVPTDDRASNLRWGTMQDNADDRIRNGSQPQGARCPASKLTEEQAREIKWGRRGRRPSELAAAFGVKTEAVRKIIRGERWRHI